MMKNTQKAIRSIAAMRSMAGIIAIAIIIGFSMIACDDSGDDNTGTTYQIGSTGPGGGIVFYDKGSDSDGWRYLEAAPADMATTLTWASSGFENTDITGTGTAIGTGKANTAAILAVDANAPAAKACKDYNGGGKDDWFLPSMDELREMYKARTHLGISSAVSFLSSSQGGSSNVLVQVFDNGDWGSSQKIAERNVRAIRAF